MTSPALYVTLFGLPLRVELAWPFHKSTSGADWYSLHGRVLLDDGSGLHAGLHADVAVNLTVTMEQALGSLEPAAAEPVVINAIRKELDIKQLELLKSGKRQPVPVSTRHYDFKNKRMKFEQADEQQLRDFLARKTYWLAVRSGEEVRSNEEARIADPVDLIYLNATPEQMIAAAHVLESEGLITMEKGFAAATAALKQKSAEFEAAKNAALEALAAKHAYERG